MLPINAKGLVGDPNAAPSGQAGGGLDSQAVMPQAGDSPLAATVMPSDGAPVQAGGALDAQAVMPQQGASSSGNVETISKSIVNDPRGELARRGGLIGDAEQIDPNAPGTDVSDRSAQGDASALEQGVAQGEAGQATGPNRQNAQGYDATTTSEQIAMNDMEAAEGRVSDEAVVEAAQIDTKAADNNYLKDFASQDISRVIDTSTVAGKLLADQLGQGNYTDSKQTVVGQMALLQKEFEGPDGEPKIPSWAAGMARSVSRTMAFKGVTGTAATAAMSQAILEATLPIAQQDAQIFSSIAMKNLDNEQQQIMNRALVLSKFDMANMDSRQQAAVQNAKSFLQMDLQNLSNEQQARVVNTQNRVQGILEDAKAENASRMFSAQADNDFTKFYTNLETQISQFNAAQTNEMARFNAGETNDMSQFNASLENSREQFYKEMQYNIDLSNANWRRNVTAQNTQMRFDAQAADARAILGITSENLNRLWDRADSLLNFTWQAGQNEADRDIRIAQFKVQSQLERDRLRQTGELTREDLALRDQLNLRDNNATDRRLDQELSASEAAQLRELNSREDLTREEFALRNKLDLRNLRSEENRFERSITSEEALRLRELNSREDLSREEMALRDELQLRDLNSRETLTREEYRLRDRLNQRDNDYNERINNRRIDAELQMARERAQAEKQGGLFGAIGSVLGSVTGGMFGSGGIFGAGAAGSTMGGIGSALGGIGSALGSVASFLPFLSDSRLKDEITPVGKHASGLTLYRWEWNDKAKELGCDDQPNVGVLAEEVQDKFPHAVGRDTSGYLTVNYYRLK